MEEIKDNDREYDIIIYGATGFTGCIIASVFLKRYVLSDDINYKWAIAGRNKNKLKKIHDKLLNEYTS